MHDMDKQEPKINKQSPKNKKLTIKQRLKTVTPQKIALFVLSLMVLMVVASFFTPVFFCAPATIEYSKSE